jgi:hypothetical protein
MSLCLGYDANAMQDGAGAQIQRIIAIEAISSFLNVGYCHQQILAIDSNYGDGLDDLQSKQKFIKQLNSYLNFSDYSCCHERHTRINFILLPRFERFFLPLLRFLKICLSRRKRSYLYLISNPYAGIRNHEGIYNLVRMRHGVHVDNKSKKLSIKIHLPWAGIGAGQLSDRKISLKWYKDILEFLNNRLTDLGYECVFTFHTDGIRGLKSNLLSLGVSQKTQDYWRENNLLSDGHLNWSYIDISSEFNFLPNVVVKFGISPIEVWDDMSKGDVLVLAKSSLSFVAGLLNINALKLVPLGVGSLPHDFKVILNEDLNFLNNLQEILARHFV